MVSKEKVVLALAAASILAATTSAAVKAHVTARSRKQPWQGRSTVRQLVAGAYYRVADPVDDWVQNSVMPALQVAVAFVAPDAAESRADVPQYSDNAGRHFAGVGDYSDYGSGGGSSSSSSDSGGGSSSD